MRTIDKLVANITLVLVIVACNNSNNQQKKVQQPDSNQVSVNTDTSQTSKIIENPRDSKEFEVFLDYFLRKLYFKDNLDRAMYNSSPDFLDFTNKELPIGRFSAPGIYQVLNSKPYFDTPDFFSTTNINLEKIEIIGNKLPDDGYCEPSNLKDAIYFKSVKKAPVGYDVANDKPDRYPSILKGLKIMQVEIQVEKMIERTMYFAFYKDKWYFIYLDDSISCGA
ncbi:MAG: hypothetical protein ACK44N_12650 [Bacteroidota bacterium]|jgi:hypothetical protein